MALEIERKFLLKRIPLIKFDIIKEISQFYCGQTPGYRLRKTSSNENIQYFLTIKNRISDMTYEENETLITKKEFNEKIKKAKSYIEKTRHIKKIGKLKWEIDSIKNMNLVIAEIEIPSEKYHFILPKFIKDNLIMEITSFRNFTNKSLSEKIKI